MQILCPFLLLAFCLIPTLLCLGISLDNDQDLLEMQRRLRQRVPCHNKRLNRRLYQKGRFWVVQNFASADHGQIDCHSIVTLTTIGDVSHLDNLLPLVRRWRAPISVALYAPGDDLHPTLDAIEYLRNCLRNAEDSFLIRQFVSFHLVFDADHVTQDLPDMYTDAPSYCERFPMKLSSYRKDNDLQLYINVLRNVARDAAITHFILPTDIHMLPSARLVPRFLRMIAFDERPLIRNRVFVVPAFDVTEDSQPPQTKRDLVQMLKNNTAIDFHVNFCEPCAHMQRIAMPRWKLVPESDDLKILTTLKRTGESKRSELYFIGSQTLPYYEERNTYELQHDRMTHMMMLCILDYDFAILDNVFLVHKPGIHAPYPKELKGQRAATRKMIQAEWLPQYISLFGPRPECY